MKGGAGEHVWPDHFNCPITMNVMKDPVTTRADIEKAAGSGEYSARTYERAAIEEWIRQHPPGSDPFTREPLPATDLVPNEALKREMWEAGVRPAQSDDWVWSGGWPDWLRLPGLPSVPDWVRLPDWVGLPIGGAAGPPAAGPPAAGPPAAGPPAAGPPAAGPPAAPAPAAPAGAGPLPRAGGLDRDDERILNDVCMALHPGGHWSCQEGTVTTSERLNDLEHKLKLPTWDYVEDRRSLKWRVQNIYENVEEYIKGKEAARGWNPENQHGLSLLDRRLKIESHNARVARGAATSEL